MASATTSFLILKSKGVSVAKLGAWLISMSQGLSFSSISTSNPNISKQREFILFFDLLKVPSKASWAY